MSILFVYFEAAGLDGPVGTDITAIRFHPRVEPGVAVVVGQVGEAPAADAAAVRTYAVV